LVGETENDIGGILGGDSRLTEEGVAWGKKVAEFLTKRESEIRAEDVDGSAIEVRVRVKVRVRGKFRVKTHPQP